MPEDVKTQIRDLTAVIGAVVGGPVGDSPFNAQLAGVVGQNAVENNSLITQRSDGNKYYTKEDDKYNLLQYLVATNQLTSDQVPNSIFKDLENTDTTFTLDGKKLNTPKSEDFEKSFYDEINNGSVISKEKYLELMNKNPEIWAEVKDAIETKQFWEGVKDPVFQYVMPDLQVGGGIGQIAVAGGVDVAGCATVVACGVAVGGSSLLIANGLDDIRTGWNNLGVLPTGQTASSTLTSLGVSEGTAGWVKLGAGGASIGAEAAIINKGLNTTISPIAIVENPVQVSNKGLVDTTYSGDVYAPDFKGPVEWDYYYRGDATKRDTFESSMTQAKGSQAVNDEIKSKGSGELSDIFAEHGISSSLSPMISTSKNPTVSEYFSKGTDNTNPQPTVTTFRIEKRESEQLQSEGKIVPNFENPMSFFEPNPRIGLPESEYLFRDKIDPKYIFEQKEVKK